jgi:DNA-binding transcriptional ArsR family regulator
MNLRRDVFQAIADPTRRAILLLVASQSMTAGVIASNFDTARPTVSKHLQILTAKTRAKRPGDFLPYKREKNETSS